MHMYVHVEDSIGAVSPSPLLCLTVIVPLLRGNRGDRFHLWSRMVMTGKRERERERQGRLVVVVVRASE